MMISSWLSWTYICKETTPHPCDDYNFSLALHQSVLNLSGASPVGTRRKHIFKDFSPTYKFGYIDCKQFDRNRIMPLTEANSLDNI
jgi:hypothetical protein